MGHNNIEYYYYVDNIEDHTNYNEPLKVNFIQIQFYNE